MTSESDQLATQNTELDGRLPYRLALGRLMKITVHTTTKLIDTANNVALQTVQELRTVDDAAFEPPLSPDLSEALRAQVFGEKSDKEIVSTERIVDLLERIIDHGSDRSYVLPPAEVKD